MDTEKQNQVDNTNVEVTEVDAETLSTKSEFNWKLLSLTLIAVIVGAGFVAAAFYYKEQRKVQPPVDLTPEEEEMMWTPPQEEEVDNSVDELSDTSDANTSESIELNIQGHMLVIKEGDVWQIDANGKGAIKLIDLDTVNSVSRSDFNSQIAYTLGQKVSETVEEYDGSTREITVTKNQLLLADEKGSDSFLVHDGVSDWGWIPGKNLIWYETSSLQQFFEWGYMGNGGVWIFDPSTKKSEQFITDNSEYFPLMRAEWSPDGEKLAFVSSGYLKVADSKSKITRELFALPYVGGNRGGPQPIPYFEWSPNSDAIYTVFTPFLVGGENTNQEIDLKTKQVAALKIPTDGSKIERVVPERPSQIANEETYPRAHYSSDFTKVFYPRVDSVKYPDTMRAQENVSLVMYDMVSKEEMVMLDNVGKPERGLMQYSVPLSWVFGDSVYLLKGDGDWLYEGATISLIKKNLITGVTEILATKENVSGNIWDIAFEPKTESIYFTTNQNLIRLNKQGSGIIAEGVGLGDVEYHLE